MNGGMELYLHMPFCVRKCAYCDFLSFPTDQETQNLYTRRLREDIDVMGKKYGDIPVDTIFIGGGTPSVPDSALIVGIMEHVRKAFHVAEGAEISMEALCPEEQGAKRCMQAADALVTKLSGGVPGLTISRICAEECRFAADADCYSCKVTAHALAYVYALANEEETEFTDFILKGEVQ